MKTPGVYIVEKSAFPNSVVEAATAIPAFIGITEKAQNGPDSLAGKPWKITSMTEYQQYFGGAPAPEFELSVVDSPDTNSTDTFYSIESAFKGADGKGKLLKVVDKSGPFSLYYHMVMFFANGGGTCYIVSVGTYDEKAPVDKDKVKNALEEMEKEQEITMVVVPEAASTADCKDIQTQVLAHCGKMMNRFAILDVQPKAAETEKMDDQIKTFRTNVGANFLSYGAAYYPWLNTSVLSDKDIDGTVLTWNFTEDAPDVALFFDAKSKFPKYFAEAYAEIAKGKKNELKEKTNADGVVETDENKKPVMEMQEVPLTDDELAVMKNNLHNALLQNLPGYQYIVNKVKDKLNLLPPSAAMAGLSRGMESACQRERELCEQPAGNHRQRPAGRPEHADERQGGERHPHLPRRGHQGMGSTHAGRQLAGLEICQCAPHDDVPRRIGEERCQGVCVRA